MHILDNSVPKDVTDLEKGIGIICLDVINDFQGKPLHKILDENTFRAIVNSEVVVIFSADRVRNAAG